MKKCVLVVLHAYLLMEQEIRKITNLGIIVPLLQHIDEIVVQILQHRMVKDNDLIQSSNI
jgi:hypothetical protein